MKRVYEHFQYNHLSKIALSKYLDKSFLRALKRKKIKYSKEDYDDCDKGGEF
jgi:hypothetical protein